MKNKLKKALRVLKNEFGACALKLDTSLLLQLPEHFLNLPHNANQHI